MNAKKLILSLGVLGAFSLSAIASGPTKDIVDTAAGNKDFSTLVSLVKTADLVETLKGKGPFTVFAPTNAAFNKVPKATLDSLGKNKDALRGVLTYHVVAGNVLAADVVKLNGRTVKTVNGADVRVSVRNGNVFLNNNVRVTTTDIRTKNGVIHVIDGVLLPPRTTSSTNPAPVAKAEKGGCSSCDK